MHSDHAAADSATQQSVQALYREHHDWLRLWLRKRLPCAEHAADLAQDTFVRVLASRQACDLREPRAYLSSIARSLMIDGFRRRNLEQAYLDALVARPEPLDISPEQRALVIETLVEIDRMLDGLGARCREIFLLAQLDGLSHVEIGRRLGLSTNTVRKYVVRALTHCMLLIEDAP
ncbi:MULTISPECIES: sigma-70 family RNA polymerase sigma factor [unclassified Pseudomonas]|uniref:sigma-70 family RNA polymerase sigma factor n=1 Tax=unclassified Pseudomonas TaxID=196821 RepID=UPI00244BEE3F|nr:MULTISPECIES: sigma-70 family RNA polymerase sigma factor [unclassified Pseudomonas]MDG9929125.1 sigma-70 family RNA polymerase sigma factor [Pseudomonas sp. GD04042]MDH0484093.1 sigma-70 family RNA polymerase sigma factor [Pseudomonas sp. GD04015]MDH0605901.1 sigma-70 family RNA polymerase sigma factor [Pseudomonas sp. GD03869]